MLKRDSREDITKSDTIRTAYPAREYTAQCTPPSSHLRAHVKSSCSHLGSTPTHCAGFRGFTRAADSSSPISLLGSDFNLQYHIPSARSLFQRNNTYTVIVTAVALIRYRRCSIPNRAAHMLLLQIDRHKVVCSGRVSQEGDFCTGIGNKKNSNTQVKTYPDGDEGEGRRNREGSREGKIRRPRLRGERIEYVD